MEPVTREELLQMVVDAREAAYSEYMVCPWCCGHIGHRNDHHDDWCPWLKVAKEVGVAAVATEGQVT